MSGSNDLLNDWVGGLITFVIFFLFIYLFLKKPRLESITASKIKFPYIGSKHRPAAKDFAPQNVLIKKYSIFSSPAQFGKSLSARSYRSCRKKH